jgi:hypothetical protein
VGLSTLKKNKRYRVMIKKLLLNKSKFLTVLVFLFAFYGNVNAQCSITTTNASTLNSSNICTTFNGCTTVYVGDGTTITTLTIDAGLNFTCLGAINLVVMKNATIVFGNGANDKLTLAEYSTLTINTGGSLNGGNNCTASDRIIIGTDLVSTCDGHAGTDVSFADIVSVGGTGSAISNSPVCVGNVINLSATPPPEKGPYTYSWSGPGLSPTTYSISPNYTLVASVSGDYVVTMKSTVLNPTPNPDAPYIIIAQAKVIVNPSMSTTPTIASATTPPTCTVPTGTITITSPTGAGITYSINGLTYTNTSGIFNTVAPGTYSVTAKNSSGCVSNVTSVTITSPDKTWNGSVSSDWNTAANWTPSGVPTSSNCVTIPSATISPIISGTNVVAYANNLTILTSGALTVKSSNTLTVTDFIKVNLGFLTFENTASLVQINNVNNNSGYIDFKRTTSARPTDYTYWSSPVSPMDLGELYPYEGTYYSYEATISGEDWKQEGSDTEMVAGKGYIANQGAAVPSGMPPPPGLLDVTFTGVPNNGSYPISVFKDKSCLLGNPYPSAIDANTFLNENTGVLFGTLYFWTHNTAIQDASNITDGSAGSGAFAYTSNDYAIYNATGGTAATQPDKDALGNPYPSSVPTGNIAAGQGFFATAKATGIVMFNNTTRVSGNNTQFFKTKNPNKTAKEIQKNRIWLNLTNAQGAFKQTLVGYITDATNKYDDRFDGESFDGNEFVDFYSVNQDKNLTIQGRALPFDDADEVPLGFRTTINGAFTINIDQVDGFLANQAVFIEDKLTNTVFDLKSGNYTFNTVAGTFNDRFVLRYKDNSSSKTLETANFDSLDKTVLVSNKNKQIKIDSAVERIDKVTVFDVLGRQIYQKANVDSNELSISNLVSNRQMLMVKTTLQNGKTVTKKIIY